MARPKKVCYKAPCTGHSRLQMRLPSPKRLRLHGWFSARHRKNSYSVLQARLQCRIWLFPRKKDEILRFRADPLSLFLCLRSRSKNREALLLRVRGHCRMTENRVYPKISGNPKFRFLLKRFRHNNRK